MSERNDLIKELRTKLADLAAPPFWTKDGFWPDASFSAHREQEIHRRTDVAKDALATIARLEAEVEAGRTDTARLAWLETHKNAEVSHEGFEDNVWQVHTVNGGRSDREWTKRGEGDTLREAIDAARAVYPPRTEGERA